MANPIKFRCFQCNQLLGVSRTKAGEVVSCPKCSAELIVPELEEVAQQLSAGPTTAFESGGMSPTRTEPSSSLENSASLDMLDIRPEDIRVVAGVVPVSPPPYTYKPPGSSEEPEPSPEPAAEPIPPAPPPEIARPKTVVEPVTPPAYQVAPQPTVVVPQIETNERLQTAQPRRAVAPPPRSRDLVIPRSVVTAWSLLVLIAVGMAFVAGLLAGHYVWGVH
jgi:hypothetical protein